MHLFAPLSTCELSKYNQTQVEKPKFSQSFCRLTKHAFSNLARVCGEREEARDKGMAKAKGGIWSSHPLENTVGYMIEEQDLRTSVKAMGARAHYRKHAKVGNKGRELEVMLLL